MERFELAKLVQWAGTLRTRKRLQKVVYLLQTAGCPIEAAYRLHFFGPYSADVAQTADLMVKVGLLQEESEEFAGGKQFNYVLSPVAEKGLAEFESSPIGRKALGHLEPFEETAKSLLSEDVRLLEVASTLAYFHKGGQDWESAAQNTGEFKHITRIDPLMGRAERLARRHVK